MNEKRPIDRQREAGASIEIGTDNDNSPISDFYKIGERRLLVVKQGAVYEVILPDKIDPKRTNPNLRPLQQRVLNYGSDNAFVCRVLLTAKELFREDIFGPQLDQVQAASLALDGLKDIITMHELRLDLEAAQMRAQESFERQQRADGSVRMPSIPDIEARCEMYMQKANHAVVCLKAIAKLFYGDDLKSKWVTSLVTLVKERCGGDSPFVGFMEHVTPFLLFIINTRNSVEHPSPSNQMKAADYSMNEDGLIVSPTIEVVHPDTPLPPNMATVFMTHMTDGLVTVFEEMMAHLCANNVPQASGLPVYLTEIPTDRRSNKEVRFGYAVNMGGNVVPFG